jgi:DNA modification methylase
MRFFCEELYRVMAPGSVTAIHIQQLLRYKVQHGAMGIRDFRGSVYTIFELAGFQPQGEVAIPKNPQRVAQRLKLHSLMFVTGKRDSRKLAPAMNDYVLFFHKPGEGRAVRGLYDKDANPGGWFTQEEWIRWASGCWDDIHETDVLDGWRSARESDEERHVCPLQLEVIRRCIKLYSAPGDLVMDPFMGIGSTAYVALQEGRDCLGFEIKESYHDLALRNVAKARRRLGVDTAPLLVGLEEKA